MGDFWDDYLVLKPLGGGLRDLFQLLFSSNVSRNNYIESPEGATLEGAKRRMLLLISILLQKTILFTKKPMLWVGFCIEFWLNLVSENKNFLTLLFNMIRGVPNRPLSFSIRAPLILEANEKQWKESKQKIHFDFTVEVDTDVGKLKLPDQKSPTFRSVVGHVDDRLELDKTIKYGDGRYLAALSVMAAKLVYENEAFIEQTVNGNWKMEFIKFFDCWDDYQEAPSTQAFMFCDKLEDPDLVVVAFRGTEPFDANAWCTDIDFSWYELPEIGKVHGGFMKALGLQKQGGWPKEAEQHNPPRTFAFYAIKEKLEEILERHKQARFVLTGHSLGGALAVLFPAILAIHGDEWMLERMDSVYTFGQPRVGDEKFGEFVMQHCFKGRRGYYRFVYSNDIVPRLPYDDKTLLFKHFGTCLYYDSLYNGQIVTEEPNKNYFSPWSMLPRHMNAVWELLRSFIIGYRWGIDYREGWFLRFLRVFGFIFPGLLDHNPQDYVNLTRLGTALITSAGIESLKID